MFNRMMVAELDSIAQWDVAVQSDSPARATESLSGMLRAALVLGRRVVVTDSMVLDGWYFLSLGPLGVAQQLGVAPTALPFTIVGLGDTLSSGLEQKRSNPDFYWQALHHPLSKWTEEGLAVRWREWLDAADSGNFRYESLGENSPGSSPFRLRLRESHRAGLHPESELVLKRIESQAARSIFVQVLSEERLRLQKEADDAAASRRADELAVLGRHWNQEYSRYIARRNNANWIQFHGDSVSNGGTAQPGGVSLKVPVQFVDLMRECTAGAFASIYSASGEAQKRLIRKPSNAALRGLAFASLEVLRVPQRRRILRSVFARVLVAAIAILAAIPGQNIDVVGISGAWLTFGAAALSTVPWSDMRILGSLVKIEERTEIVFFEGA